MLMGKELKYRTCHLCEAMCGLEIEVEDNKVLSIKGHKEDIYSKGHICPKGVALKDLHEDKNRLKRPVKRTDNGWVEISWNEAFDAVERELKKIRKKYGNDAIATYTGNPTVHNTGTALTLYDTINAIDTKNRYASHSLDSVPVFLVNQMMFGHAMLAPVPDIESLDYFLIIGANPLASNGSFMSTPDIKGKISNIKSKGKVVVIDPRKTETAKKASEHYFIKPERDIYLLLGIANELFKRTNITDSLSYSYIKNIDQLQEVVSEYDLENIAPLTGMSADDISKIIDDLLSHKNPVVYGRLGVNTQRYGTLCQWLITSVNILLGQLDKPGGLLFTLPAIDYVTLMAHESKMFRYKSRVKSYGEIVGEYPTATLAEEILTPGEGQVRGFLSIAGNPARSAPNSDQVEEALKSLEFMVAVDMYINETTQYADIILPPAVGLETMHYSFVLHMVATKNTSKFSPPPLQVSDNQRYDYQIMSELQRRLFSGGVFSKAKNYITSKISPKRKLDLALKTGPYGIWGGRKFKKDGLSLSKLEKKKEGVFLSELSGQFPDRLFTKDKKVELTPELFVKELQNLKKESFEAKDDKHPFTLIGRRHLRSNNSWMHNLPILQGGSRKCTAMIHPQDASFLSISDDQMIEVYSKKGSISIAAEVSDEIVPGTISIPHGWGHHGKNIRMDVAQEESGVNVNLLMDHERLDPLSYNMAFNGHPVGIRAISS